MQAPPLPAALDFPRIKILAVGSSGCGKSCLIKRYCEGRFVSKYIPTIGIDYGVKKVDVKPSVVLQHRQALTGGSGNINSNIGGGGGVADGKNPLTAVRVNFWDVAGGEESFHIRNEFYAPAQGVLLMFDVRSRESFQALDVWLEEMNAYIRVGVVDSAGHKGAYRRTSQTTTSNTPAGRAVGDLNGQQPILYLVATKVDDVAAAPGEATRRLVAEAEARAWAERHGCVQYVETSAAADTNVVAAMEDLFYDVMATFFVSA